MLFTRWEESNQDEKDGIIHVLKELGKCHMRKQGGPDLGESQIVRLEGETGGKTATLRNVIMNKMIQQSKNPNESGQRDFVWGSAHTSE